MCRALFRAGRLQQLEQRAVGNATSAVVTERPLVLNFEHSYESCSTLDNGLQRRLHVDSSPSGTRELNVAAELEHSSPTKTRRRRTNPSDYDRLRELVTGTGGPAGREEANAIFNMLLADRRAQVHHLNLMLQSCFTSVEKDELVRRACANGIKPTIVTYTLQLRQFMLEGEHERAQEILESMSLAGVVRDAKLCKLIETSEEDLDTIRTRLLRQMLTTSTADAGNAIELFYSLSRRQKASVSNLNAMLSFSRSTYCISSERMLNLVRFWRAHSEPAASVNVGTAIRLRRQMVIEGYDDDTILQRTRAELGAPIVDLAEAELAKFPPPPQEKLETVRNSQLMTLTCQGRIDRAREFCRILHGNGVKYAREYDNLLRDELPIAEEHAPPLNSADSALLSIETESVDVVLRLCDGVLMRRFVAALDEQLAFVPSAKIYARLLRQSALEGDMEPIRELVAYIEAKDWVTHPWLGPLLRLTETELEPMRCFELASQWADGLHDAAWNKTGPFARMMAATSTKDELLAALVACSHHSEHMLRAIDQVTVGCEPAQTAAAIARVSSVVLAQLVLEGSTDRLALACSSYGLHQVAASHYDHSSASEERCRQIKHLVVQGKLESAQTLFRLFAAGGNVNADEVLAIMPTLATTADVIVMRKQLPADSRADAWQMMAKRLVVLGAREAGGRKDATLEAKLHLRRQSALEYLVAARPTAARAMLTELLQNNAAAVGHINFVAGVAATSADMASWVATAHERSVPLDVNTLNIMLNRLLMEGDIARCEQVVREMAAAGIVGNATTDGIMTRQRARLEKIRSRSLGTSIRAGHIEEAITLLDAMRRSRVHTKVHVLTVAAGARSLAELQAAMRGVAKGKALPIEEAIQRHLDRCMELSGGYA